MSSVMTGYDTHNDIFLKWPKITWKIECILSVHLRLVNITEYGQVMIHLRSARERRKSTPSKS